MSETLGSLCDKLIITELKKLHTSDQIKLEAIQERIIILKEELDEYVNLATQGKIAKNRLVVASNKIYNESKYVRYDATLSLGGYICELSRINLELWKEQEKVYEFESVPTNLKNQVIHSLAQLNLERNELIERIDLLFFDAIRPLLDEQPEEI